MIMMVNWRVIRACSMWRPSIGPGRTGCILAFDIRSSYSGLVSDSPGEYEEPFEPDRLEDDPHYELNPISRRVLGPPGPEDPYAGNADFDRQASGEDLAAGFSSPWYYRYFNSHDSPITIPDETFAPDQLAESDPGSEVPEHPELSAWDPREPLTWLLPELSHIRKRAEILRDSSRPETHEHAARDVIKSLNIAAQGLLDLNRRLPVSAKDMVHSESEDFLYSLGHRLDRTLRASGLQWPPPGIKPPAVCLDLIYLYKCASRQIVPVGADVRLLLQDQLKRVVVGLASYWKSGKVGFRMQSTRLGLSCMRKAHRCHQRWGQR